MLIKERKIQLKEIKTKISETKNHLKVLKKYNLIMWLRGATAGIIVSLLAAGLYNFLYQDAFLKIFFLFSFLPIYQA